jgi:hypothetical protein
VACATVGGRDAEQCSALHLGLAKKELKFYGRMPITEVVLVSLAEKQHL